MPVSCAAFNILIKLENDHNSFLKEPLIFSLHAFKISMSPSNFLVKLFTSKGYTKIRIELFLSHIY